MSENFNHDGAWSKHKDILLKPFWGNNSFGNRYVIVGSMLLQKTHGIDIILQNQNDFMDITLDTKHIKGIYNAFWFEDESCPKYETLGWARKPKEESADYICYCFWEEAREYGCRKCRKDCLECRKFFTHCEMYLLSYPELFSWYDANKDRFALDTISNRNTINKTTGRLIPIATYQKEVGLIKKTISIGKKIHAQTLH